RSTLSVFLAAEQASGDRGGSCSRQAPENSSAPSACQLVFFFVPPGIAGTKAFTCGPPGTEAGALFGREWREVSESNRRHSGCRAARQEHYGVARGADQD